MILFKIYLSLPLQKQKQRFFGLLKKRVFFQEKRLVFCFFFTTLVLAPSMQTQ